MKILSEFHYFVNHLCDAAPKSLVTPRPVHFILFEDHSLSI